MSSEQLKNHLRRNCLGRKNAVKSPELERTLRISGNELRRQVNRLRRKKVPICSGPEGYFYAGNAGEIYATIRSLEWSTPSRAWRRRWRASASAPEVMPPEQLHELDRRQTGPAGGGGPALSSGLRALYRGLWRRGLGPLPQAALG